MSSSRAYCPPDGSPAGSLGHVLQLALFHCAGQCGIELWLSAPCAKTEGHGWHLERPLGQGGSEGSTELRHINDIWGLVQKDHAGHVAGTSCSWGQPELGRGGEGEKVPRSLEAQGWL